MSSMMAAAAQSTLTMDVMASSKIMITGIAEPANV